MNKIISLFILIFTFQLLFAQEEIPATHENLEKPITYEQMDEFIAQISGQKIVTVTVEGKTKENRKLYLLHFSHCKKTDWKVFFFAQQHGNEPAGKDALIYLSKKIAEDPEYLPENVELWIMPMVNPDGAVKNKRRNANDADLNRDHLLLRQEETQILHRVYRKIMPHISVDCHEFGRDSRDYAEMGWSEWPLIMMDCGNNPLMNKNLYSASVNWIKRIAPKMKMQGFNYCRYYLGGLPPNEELRHSTMEADDARNSLAFYGGLSFIIESGIYKNTEDPNYNLNERVGAYLQIFEVFLNDESSREKDIAIIEKSRTDNVPAFIPTNYFWGNNGGVMSKIKVIEKSTNKMIEIFTQNFMGERITKNSIKMPQGYIISKKNIDQFRTILDRHEISYEILEKNKIFKVESGKLIRFEDYRDPVYNRYGGRQIVDLQKPVNTEFPVGSMIVMLNQEFPERIINKLEPALLYGVYQYESFRKLIDENKTLPVFRIIADK